MFLIYNIHNYFYFLIKNIIENIFVLNWNKFIKYIKIYENNIYYYIYLLLYINIYIYIYIYFVDIIILFFIFFIFISYNYMLLLIV